MTDHQPLALAPDPLLPHRDRLLDAETVAAQLSLHLGRPVRALGEHGRPLRATYHVGESLRVLHQLDVAGRRLTVSARTFPPDRAADVFRRAAGVARIVDDLEGVIHGSEIDTVFWLFPNDRKITGLPELREEAGALARRLGGPDADTTVAAYGPERCVTLALGAPARPPVAFAKIYAGEGAIRCAHAHRTLASQLPLDQAHLRLVPLLEESSSPRMLVLTPAHGRRVADFGGGDAPAVIARLGAAVATLHDLEAPAGAPTHDRSSPHAIAAAAVVIARARPDLGDAAEMLARDLIRRDPSSHGHPVCLHGDLHPKNAIVEDGRIALLDLDQVAVGPAAADVGSFLALLRYRRIIGELSPADEATCGWAFLAGYRQIRSLPHGTIAWHLATALFVERARRAVTRLRTAGIAHLGALLANASALLKERPHV